MFFGFHPWIRQVLDREAKAQFPPGLLNHVCELQHRELLGELVEHAVFAASCWMQTSQFDATNGVTDIEKASGLPTLSIYGQRMLDRRLHAEAIERGAENLVIIETVHQRRIESDFFGQRAVDHALIEIGCAQPPNLATEHDVVTVVHLGEVIEGAGLFGEGKHVLAAVMLNFYEPFFDVDIRCAVFAHGPQLHQMAVALEFTDDKENVESADYVVHLREDSMPAVDHGIRSRALFGEVHDRLRLESSEHRGKKLVIGHISDERFDLPSREAIPGSQAVRQRTDGCERGCAQFVIPQSTTEIIHAGYFVSLLGEVERRRPAAITVSTQHCDLHKFSSGEMDLKG